MCGGGCWWLLVFFKEISSEISKNKAFFKDPACCFLPKLVLFALLTLAEVFVHLITLSHVVHLSSRRES